MFQLIARRPMGSSALTWLKQVRNQRGAETPGASLLHAAEDAVMAGKTELAISALERFQLVAVGLTPEHNALIQLSVIELRRPFGGNLLRHIGFHFVVTMISSSLHEWCRGLLNSLSLTPFLRDKGRAIHEYFARARITTNNL